jgi:propanol-preferring alcohol dehydrogenase
MPTPIELPKTYKACIYDNPGSISIKIVDLDMPEPGPGDVLVKLSAPDALSNPRTG